MAKVTLKGNAVEIAGNELKVGDAAPDFSLQGQDLAEYAILLGLIAIVCYIAVQALGVNIRTLFQTLASQIGALPG